MASFWCRGAYYMVKSLSEEAHKPEIVKSWKLETEERVRLVHFNYFGPYFLIYHIEGNDGLISIELFGLSTHYGLAIITAAMK